MTQSESGSNKSSTHHQQQTTAKRRTESIRQCHARTPVCLGNPAVYEQAALKPRNDTTPKKVRFSNDIISFEIPSTYSDTKASYEDSIKRRWYSAQDLERIREENELTVELIHSGRGLQDEEVYCKRGLEEFYRTQRPCYLRSRQEIIEEVLDRQVDLWMNKSLDHAVFLAGEYRLRSLPHAERARITALHDSRSG